MHIIFSILMLIFMTVCIARSIKEDGDTMLRCGCVILLIVFIIGAVFLGLFIMDTSDDDSRSNKYNPPVEVREETNKQKQNSIDFSEIFSHQKFEANSRDLEIGTLKFKENIREEKPKKIQKTKMNCQIDSMKKSDDEISLFPKQNLLNERFIISVEEDSSPIKLIDGMIKIPNRDFYIGKYEVTQSEYESIMGNNPSYFRGSNLPVENVSWNEAMLFCEKLTSRERNNGRLPKGYKYTLPTSEQWEIACRAGTTTRFCSGNSSGDLTRVAWWDGNSDNKTHPVGTKAPNAWGIYDMHGNVWEWCLDAHPNYPSGRVNRGGGWGSDVSRCVSLGVSTYDPDDRSSILGFRVALVPENSEE